MLKDDAGIDNRKVTAWMRNRLPDLKPPLKFSLITGGHSNLSYKCVDQAGAAYVLRRPPLGNVLESAHDMVREHRIVSAMDKSLVPVAPIHGLCEDIRINGAPFYLMGFVEGLVLHDVVHARTLSMEDRALLSEHVVKVLTDLHLTDLNDVGLDSLARKEAYLARQLKRWTQQWEATKTHEVPEMDECAALLKERMPEQIGATVVHGDYRLGNMLVADGCIQAVLDWELCTLGDPLADLGYLLNNWAEPGDPNSDLQPTGIGGFWSRDKICDVYTASTGRDLTHINYYRAFSHWRLAAINQGVYKRYLVGAMGDGQAIDLEEKKESVQRRAESTLSLLEC